MCELMNETKVYSSDLSGSPLLRFVTGAVALQSTISEPSDVTLNKAGC